MQGGPFNDDEQAQLLALQAVPSLAALLRHAVRSGAQPVDGVTAKLSTSGLEVEFWVGDVPVHGLAFDA